MEVIEENAITLGDKLTSKTLRTLEDGKSMYSTMSAKKEGVSAKHSSRLSELGQREGVRQLSTKKFKKDLGDIFSNRSLFDEDTNLD